MNEQVVMGRAPTMRGHVASWDPWLNIWDYESPAVVANEEKKTVEAWCWFRNDMFASALCYRVLILWRSGPPPIAMSFGTVDPETQRMLQSIRFPASRMLPFVVVATLDSRAIAQPSSEPDTSEPPAPSAEPDTRPWAIGVPEEAQRRAQELFAEGNGFLDNLGYATAAAKFRQAIESWAHPAIQYNLAIALIKLDQPIEAYQSIIQALRYGAAPLDSEQYEQALNYKQLLRKQLGEIELSCAQDGVKVKLDGKLVLTCSGTTRTLLLLGEHQLVATKQGLRTVTKSLLVTSSATMKVQLRLFTEQELTGTKRYWKSWQPWALAAAGAGIAMAGGALHYWGARANIDAFDAQLARDCPFGCHDNEPGSPSALLRRGELQQQFAWGSYVVGGLAAATGIVGVVVNLPRQVPLDRSSEETRMITIGISPSPVGGGLRIAGRF